MVPTFETYFSRFEVLPKRLSNPIDSNVNMIVTIPCYDEPNILDTLQSLQNCEKPSCAVEVIIVVNNSESAPERVKTQNKQTFEEILAFNKQNDKHWIQFMPILEKEMPEKFAGVGLARKIAMDEAIYRFNEITNPNGIIISCDADTLVESNYFVAIEEFYKTTDNKAATLYFEHPLEGDLPKYQYHAIAQYELYMRYYIEQLRRCGFPFLYHTVGSCFSIQASAYCKQGGMNKRQAGEDFYFLQKVFQAEKCAEIRTTTVHPSSRVSDRVPFGTGTVVAKITDFSTNKTPQYKTFAPESFDILQMFFSQISDIYDTEPDETFLMLHPYLQEFLTKDVYSKKISEIKKNSTSLHSFQKRFFNWFNGFMVYKFLNFVHQNKIERIPIEQVAADLIGSTEYDVFELLKKYRTIAKKTL